MRRLVRIFADDLTGAADTGVSLLGLGARVTLSLRPDRTSGGVIDLDIRDAPDSVARERLARIAPLAAGREEICILKVDSTLRGPVSAIIETALALAATTVICPAFPETGRTVHEGRVLLDGNRGEETDFGRSQGLGARQARVPGLPAGPAEIAAGRLGLLQTDAGSTDDLDRIARAVLAARQPPMVIGAGGIARALMRAMGASAPPPLPVLSGPALWVAGSATPILHAQIARLGPLEPPETASPGADAGLTASRADKGTVLEPSVARNLVTRAAKVAARFPTIFASGGTTARALLEKLGLDEIDIAGEIAPGTVAFDTGLAAPRHILVRSGGFGSECDLVALRARIGPPVSAAG